MATVNRRPFSVNAPSSSNVQNYFYTNNAFKGLYSSKNFETVDQSSFEDCDNVYVDKFGLLRSRPAVKEDKNITGNVLRVWSFNSVTVVMRSGENGSCTITVSNSLFPGEPKSHTFATRNVKPVLYKNSVYFFEKDSAVFYRYDISENSDIAEDAPYVPITRAWRNGTYTPEEKKNFLTSAERTRYFTTIFGSPIQDLVGQNISFEFDGNTYTVNPYVKEFATTLVRKGAKLPDEYNSGLVELSVSEDNGLIAVTNWSANRNNYAYYLSTNQKDFVEIGNGSTSTGAERYYKLSLSNDGLTLFSIRQSYYAPGSFGLIRKEVSEVESDEWTGVQALDPYATAYSFYAISKDYWVVAYYRNGSVKVLACNDGTVEEKTLAVTSAPFVSSAYAHVSTACVCYVKGGVFSYAVGVIGKSAEENAYHNVLGYNSETPTITYWTNLDNFPFEETAPQLAVRLLNGKLALAFSRVASDRLRESVLLEAAANGKFTSAIVSRGLTSEKVQFSYPSGLLIDDKNVNVPDQFGRYSGTRFVNYSRIAPTQFFYNTESSYGTNGLYGIKDGYLYTNALLTDELEIDVTANSGEFGSPIFPDYWAELDRLYFASGTRTYRDFPNTENKLYFPEDNVDSFPDKITALHQLTSESLAVFLRTGVYCIYYDSQSGFYRYTKTRIQVGCKDGAEICTSYDNSYVIFPSDRGLAALSYEQLTSSTEQVVTYLSEPIYPTYLDFDDAPIKLYKHGFWLILYKENSNKLLVFDFRSMSWWPMTSPVPVQQVCDIGFELRIIGTDGKVMKLSTDDENYLDLTGDQIVWHFKSQKLHLNATNYTKHIQNITLNSVLDTQEYEFDAILTVTTFRKVANLSTAKSFDFIVDGIRIFVQRLNYFDVNEFQYELASNTTEADTDAIRIPLSLTSLSIKYRIGGQVR